MKIDLVPLMKLCSFILFLLLVACKNDVYAPVVEGWQQPAGQKGGYRVQKGDTVYSIAWEYGMDYRDIVKANHLSAPYIIHVGQKLDMSSSHSSTCVSSFKKIKAASTKTLPTSTKIERESAKRIEEKPISTSSSLSLGWIWPTQGKVCRTFCTGSNGNRGIDIAGKLGQPILASASGKVVYSGGGLRGYGQLIIVKHNDSYLSAYAFNKTLLVKEGMTVKVGQKIALMGKNESGHSALHFEIRRDGKPVDPMLYLCNVKDGSKKVK